MERLEPKEPRVVRNCCNCGADICEGDTFYDLPLGDWCEDCIESLRKIAE